MELLGTSSFDVIFFFDIEPLSHIKWRSINIEREREFNISNPKLKQSLSTNIQLLNPSMKSDGLAFVISQLSHNKQRSRMLKTVF